MQRTDAESSALAFGAFCRDGKRAVSGLSAFALPAPLPAGVACARGCFLIHALAVSVVHAARGLPGLSAVSPHLCRDGVGCALNFSPTPLLRQSWMQLEFDPRRLVPRDVRPECLLPLHVSRGRALRVRQRALCGKFSDAGDMDLVCPLSGKSVQSSSRVLCCRQSYLTLR